MGQAWTVAMIRAGTGGMFTAGSAFFATLATGAPVKVAGIAAGAAFCAVMLSRGGAEGLYDTLAASTAEGHPPAPLPAPVPPAPPAPAAPAPAAPAPLIGEPPRG